MVTALYRRYRPETFAELIGQSQVTDPLRTALRTDRVNHAYLFSGPRGCGKTTSARILARCLNCVEGPTDTPCGVCPSCVELSRDGGGSMDVVEIDAASHNGVDDARDIRDRAVFAPARDRYKIFILDEAHMVTPQGFNALLKIVEEPPEHVKFIFATTEPEKVIGTIRSRTHHYPFRLVPPAQMLEYIQSICVLEGIEVEGGVLALVVRAGGGSVRDTLSILDQLIAGSDPSTGSGQAAIVRYERAVALLGYTHGTLLSEVIDALADRDAAAAFTSVDKVIQTGQDPRRFVEDLLERLRDLIIVGATSDGAGAVLRGIQQDELDRMAAQASRFGTAELSRAADVVNAGLTEMTGATSPRLHLELMIARVLVPASDDTERGALARVERLERRIGVSEVSVETVKRVEPVETSPTKSSGPVEETRPVAVPASATAETVTLQQVKDAWPEILEVVEKAKRSAWMVVFTAKPLELREGNVLVLSFASQLDVDALKQQSALGEGVGDHLKQAVFDVLGFRPALLARAEVSRPAVQERPAVVEDVPPADDGWATTAPVYEPEPTPDEPPADEPPADEPPADEPEPPVHEAAVEAPAPIERPSTSSGAEKSSRSAAIDPEAKQRYGEAVVREILGANFIEEQVVAPRVSPRDQAVSPKEH
ncbi:MAG: polymerase subunit gamma and tau [Microbacteriaceae bacterium]|nr:polymerase subunit gamma and tau [Microbacteriaceae bacterium]